ncbi:MAG: hypothetical protein AAFU61_09110 [Pseudomonadota bacterium]
MVAAAVAWAHEAYLNSARRRERARDVQIALAAEIRAYVAVLERDDPAEHGRRMEERILQAGDGEDRFTPFVLQERNDTVFQALLPDIQVVSREAVDDVVVYCQQIVAIAAPAEDMRTEGYAGLGGERRAAIHSDCISMKTEALRLGRTAVQSLSESVERSDARR